MSTQEILLQDDPNQIVTFPLQHLDLWFLYKKAVASFWTAEEVDLSKDVGDWERLTPDEQHFLSHVLSEPPSIEGTWSAIKRSLRGTMRRMTGGRNHYLAEQCGDAGEGIRWMMMFFENGRSPQNGERLHIMAWMLYHWKGLDLETEISKTQNQFLKEVYPTGCS
ncbi:ribonucleoside-diphosphate reductase small chain [Trichonephila clavipes]|nr:ribonucleoside-diphosphate reductase small chain [Trichonephila clavipes]